MISFQVSVKGQVFTGSYEVRGHFVFVECWLGIERAPIGLMRPDKLARHLLKVLVRRNTVDGAVPIPVVAAKRQGRPRRAAAAISR